MRLHHTHQPLPPAPLHPPQITFEAHPREWQDPTPAWLYAGPKDTPSLRPFMRAQVRGAALLGLSALAAVASPMRVQ